MVGYGSALRIARRPGWEKAYVDYEALKLILTRIEAVYEEALELERNCESHKGSTNAENLLYASFEDDSDNESIGDLHGDSLESYGTNYASPAFTHASEVPRSGTISAEEQPLVQIHSSGINNVEIRSGYGGINVLSNSNILSRQKYQKPRSFDNDTKPKPNFHMRRAHRKARYLASRFFGLLQSEVEKVSLFALSRQGELADTIGSLRFGDHIASSVIPGGGLWNNPYHTHPSYSSSSEGERNGSFDSIDGSLTRAERRNRNGTSNARSLRRKGLCNRQGRFQEHVNRTRPLFRRSDFVVGGDMMLSTGVDEIDAYTSVGVELLHLLRYICINAMAVRKILKKHDKLLSNCMLGGRIKIVDNTGGNKKLLGSADTHLQHLANSLAIDAISESLMEALNEYQLELSRAEMLQKAKVDANTGFKSFRSVDTDAKAALRSDSFDYTFVKALSASECDDQSDETSSAQTSFSNQSKIRLEYTMGCIKRLRKAAIVMNTSFDAFLHRSVLMVTGQNLGGISGSSRDALDLLLSFDPDSIFEMNLLSIFEKSDVYRRCSIDYSDTSLLMSVERDDKRFIMNWATQYLNITSVFLFTINYYIATPTAPEYAIQLGHHPSVAGSIIGVTSVAALISSLVCSYLPLITGFRFTLIWSSCWPIIGNLMYAYAITARSLYVAMIGRALVGFGSAETANRVIIASSVPKQYISFLSGLFVVAGALGMSVGPFIAGILDTSVGRDDNIDMHLLGGIIINNLTSPGFLCAFLWSIQLFLLIFFFEEPEPLHGHSVEHHDDNLKLSRSYSDIRVDLKETYSSPEKVPDGSNRTLSTDSSATQQSRGQRWYILESIPRTWKLVTQTRTLPVTLLLYFFIELADEVIISSCAIITGIYFQWKPVNAGFMVASLGILSLPANVFIESIVNMIDERKIMIHSLGFTCFALLCLINIQAIYLSYFVLKQILTSRQGFTIEGFVDIRSGVYDWSGGTYQYVIAASFAFIGTMILEGVVTSLMSKASPPKLNKSFLNCGLIATMIGTVGRISGDILITLAGWMRNHAEWDYVNSLYVPVIFVCMIGIVVVRRNYFYLSC